MTRADAWIDVARALYPYETDEQIAEHAEMMRAQHDALCLDDEKEDWEELDR